MNIVRPSISLIKLVWGGGGAGLGVYADYIGHYGWTVISHVTLFALWFYMFTLA